VTEDEITPHPVYGQQSWVSIINPGDANRAAVEAMLTEAHDRVARRHRGRNADLAGGDR
jgi:predicted DNA-binding protein (MmcQ/YjbR family)